MEDRCVIIQEIPHEVGIGKVSVNFNGRCLHVASLGEPQPQGPGGAAEAIYRRIQVVLRLANSQN